MKMGVASGRRPGREDQGLSAGHAGDEVTNPGKTCNMQMDT